MHSPKKHLFGEITNGQMQPSHIGRFVEECISDIPNHHKDAKVWNHVVMPNHVHIFLQITQDNNVGREISQTRFHEHIIRNKKAFDTIMMYINHNVENWDKDCFYE